MSKLVAAYRIDSALRAFGIKKHCPNEAFHCAELARNSSLTRIYLKISVRRRGKAKTV
jgi:hypothetical protein